MTFNSRSQNSPTSAKKPAKTQLVVVGDGPVAQAVLLMAAHLGLSVAQVRARPVALPQNAVPRAYAIAPKVQARLTELGVWGLLSPQQVQPATRMQVFWQGLAGSASLPLDAGEAGVPQLCSFVAEYDLSRALGLAVQVVAHGREQHGGAVRSVITHADGVTVALDNGAMVDGELLLVADGAHSPVRKLLGLDPTVYDYQHRAVVAVLSSDRAHQGTAWQWLDATGGVLALLPLPLGEGATPASQYGLVWSLPHTQALKYLADPQTMLAALNDCAAASAGALQLASAVSSFPLAQALAPALCVDKVVLLGDAAHRIHPLAGQGLNLGFEDVFALESVLAQREWRGCGDARLLARYCRLRNAPLHRMTTAVHAIARRSDWPSWMQQCALRGLQFLEQRPALGGWFRRKIILSATQV